MSVAWVSEISATSSKSFEDAITQGLAQANIMRSVRKTWLKEQVRVSNGAVVEYQVNMMVAFVSEHWPR